MDTPAPKFLFLFFLFILIVCSTGALNDIQQQKLQTDEQILHSSHRKLVTNTIQHDLVNFPTLTSPTNPVTVNVPPNTQTPAIITVPSATPVTVTPTPPSNPVTVPPANPSTNPTNPPVPVTNPVTTPSTNNPVVAPPAATGAPAAAGQSWCVAKSGVAATSVQAALDYACGIGGADCSAIQQGASCYNPNTLQNHASFAFNSYYQRHPGQTSCDFGGAAVLTNVNPSSGSCIFPTSSSSTSPTTASPATTTPTSPTTASPATTTPTSPMTASPATTTPTTTTPAPITTTPTPTPTTASSSGATPASSATPPTILNASNPAFGGVTTGFGESPSITNTTSISKSTNLQQPFISCIIVVTSIIVRGIVLDI